MTLSDWTVSAPAGPTNPPTLLTTTVVTFSPVAAFRLTDAGLVALFAVAATAAANAAQAYATPPGSLRPYTPPDPMTITLGKSGGQIACLASDVRNVWSAVTQILSQPYNAA